MPPVPDRELIEPISINKNAPVVNPHLTRKRTMLGVIWTCAIVLLLALWFVLSAKTVIVQIEPVPDQLSLQGDSLSLALKDRFLAQPGQFRLQAHKQGYYPLDESVTVGRLGRYLFQRTLQKKPGRISVELDPPHPAQVYIDERYVGIAPLQDIELGPGIHSIELQHYRHQTLLAEIAVEGAEKSQRFTYRLLPDWARVSLDSRPSGATAWINGEAYGTTPLVLELDAGTQHLELVHPDFAAHIADFVVLPNQPLDLGVIELGREPSYMLIETMPSGAQAMVNGVPHGNSPLTVAVQPNTDYELKFELAGYRPISKMVRVAPEQSKTLKVALQPILGSVSLQVMPQTAAVYVDGKKAGYGNQQLSLTTAAHSIEVRESGYQSQIIEVHPSTDQPLTFEIQLELNHRLGQAAPATLTNRQGQSLILIRPGTFTMGASRREQGRRANETLRPVELRRDFYIGRMEVTNEEFNRFDASHSSGSYRGVDLSGPQLPVVNVSWEQAARYCNWLSQQEDLPVMYRERNGRVEAVDPLLHGYRLVTEAEWAWVARHKRDGTLLKYSWGNDYPPTQVVGNFADEQAKRIVGLTIPGYDDAHAGLAPVGSYTANHYGIHDMDGNAAEWMHDYYTIYAAGSSQVAVDPSGPGQGKHKVIRGASWLRGTLSNTRLAYREYRDQPQPDVGFRIARYRE